MSQPPTAQEPAVGQDGYSAMCASMREHRAAEYERARVVAMADQHTAYEDRLAAEAADRSDWVQLRVPARQVRLQAIPAVCWDLVHYRMMSVRQVAVRLGIKPAGVLELLAEHKDAAEVQELKAMRAIDVAMAAGHGR